METKNWIKEHPIIANFIGIVAICFVLYILFNIFLTVYTVHGKEVIVPDITKMTYSEAAKKLEDAGFEYTVMDSIYSENLAPGAVVEQIPLGGSSVKPNRTILLSVNALHPKMVVIPDFTDMSARQCKSALVALGFKNIDEVKVPSEYEGLVLGVYINNKSVVSGSKVAVNTRIEIRQGDGSISQDAPQDTIVTEDENTTDANAFNLD